MSAKITENEWLAELEKFALGIPESVPAGFLTVSQLAQLWKKTPNTTLVTLKKMGNRVEIKKFTVRTGTRRGVYPVDHYRLKKASLVGPSVFGRVAAQKRVRRAA